MFYGAKGLRAVALMATPWYGSQFTVFDAAVEIAKRDGVALPENVCLRSKSFVGTDHYWIVGSDGIPLHKVRMDRIRRLLEEGKEGKNECNDEVQGPPVARDLESDCDSLREKSCPSTEMQKIYRLKTHDFFVCSQISRLDIEARRDVIACILQLDMDLGYELVETLSDCEGEDLLGGKDGVIRRLPPSEAAEWLASRQIETFFLESQELFYASEDEVNMISARFLEVLSLLSIIKRIDNVFYLNLDAEDRRSSDYDYRMSRWVDIYSSFFPVSRDLL